jgi:hypothetical protein
VRVGRVNERRLQVGKREKGYREGKKKDILQGG